MTMPCIDCMTLGVQLNFSEYHTILSKTFVLVNTLCLSTPIQPLCSALYGWSQSSANYVSLFPTSFLSYPEEGGGEGKDLPSSPLLAILIDSFSRGNSWPQFSAPIGTHRMRLMLLHGISIRQAVIPPWKCYQKIMQFFSLIIYLQESRISPSHPISEPSLALIPKLRLFILSSLSNIISYYSKVITMPISLFMPCPLLFHTFAPALPSLLKYFPPCYHFF